MTSVAVLGSAGYTGQETLDRVLAHPGLEPVAIGSNSSAGKPAASLDPRLPLDLPTLVTNDEAAASGAELIFLCLDNDAAAAFEPPTDATVIDLSGSHRLTDPAVRAEWYGDVPAAWSYGLPEIAPAEGRLIANPGCYATAALLALYPLADVIDSAIVDGKSGMTGAGRSLKDSSHAGFVLENFSAYAVSGHRHAPEIAQSLGFDVTFVPHLMPVRRGLLATCYVKSETELRPLIEAAYAESDVVRVLPSGATAEVARVRNTDAAEISIFQNEATGSAVVICAIDNLGKGAAGQAIQNANLALGLPQTTGLRLGGVPV